MNEDLLKINIRGDLSPYSFDFAIMNGFRDSEGIIKKTMFVRLIEVKALLTGTEKLDITIRQSANIKDLNGNLYME